MKAIHSFWLLGGMFLLLVFQTIGASEEYPGFTQPYQEVNVAASEAGVIAELVRREGDRVEAGEILGHLDLSVLEASLRVAELEMNAKGAYKAAQANLKLKQSRLDTLRRLHTTNFASSEELAVAETETEEAASEVLRQEEHLAIKRAEYQRILALIELRKIKTPITGVLTKQHLHVGEYVSAISPTVFTVSQLDRLVVYFSLPVQVARQLQEGQNVTLKFSLSSGNGIGIIDRISPVIDGKSLSVKIRVVIENPNGKYQSGEKCSVVLNTP